MRILSRLQNRPMINKCLAPSAVTRASHSLGSLPIDYRKMYQPRCGSGKTLFGEGFEKRACSNSVR